MSSKNSFALTHRNSTIISIFGQILLLKKLYTVINTLLSTNKVLAKLHKQTPSVVNLSFCSELLLEKHLQAFHSQSWTTVTCLGSGWLITFPGHLCQPDFSDPAIVDNTQDEKHNHQNKATDCCYDKLRRLQGPLRQKSRREQEEEEIRQGVTQQKNPQRIFPLPNTQYLDFAATNHMEEDDE